MTVEVKHSGKSPGNCSICNQHIFYKHLEVVNHNGKKTFRFCAYCMIMLGVHLEADRRYEEWLDERDC